MNALPIWHPRQHNSTLQKFADVPVFLQFVQSALMDQRLEILRLRWELQIHVDLTIPFSIHLHKKVISALEIEPAAFHSSVNVLVSAMVNHVPFVLVEMSVGIPVFPDSTTIAKTRTTKRSLCHWMNVRSLQIATMSGHVDALQLFQNVPYAKMDPALPWTFPPTLPESVIPVPLTSSVCNILSIWIAEQPKPRLAKHAAATTQMLI
jgi:hypothetical protein